MAIELPKALAREWDWSAGEGRRASAALKAKFYRECHKPLVIRHIQNRLQDSEVQEEVAGFASRTNNLVRSVAEVVPVAYNRGATREVPGLSEPTREAFAAIVAESGIGRLAMAINALCWLLGPVLVGPVLVDGGQRLHLDIILPDCNEVKLRYAEALGAALWHTSSSWVTADDQAWRYFDAKGNATGEMPHAAGRCPLAIFRCEDYLLDWWGQHLHGGLVDASLDVAYKHALGLWARQNSGNQLTVINAQLEGIPPGQTIAHSARPLVIHEPQNSNPVSVHNRSINPAEYLSEMAAIIEAAVSRYGIPPSEVSYANNNSNWGSLSISVRGERLGLLRDRQVPWLHQGEAQLWPLVCDVVRGSPHPLARKLPPGDEVRQAQRIRFPDLASPKDVMDRIAAFEAGLRHGLTNADEVLMAGKPETTRADAAEERRRNFEDYANDIEKLASRNISFDPERGVQTVAQLQGREGGRASGLARAPQEKN